MSIQEAHPAARIHQLGADRILIEVAGRWFLIPATCPHRKGRLRFGRVNPRTLRISCPLHHATFDLLTGRRVGGPMCGPLPVKELTDDAHPRQSSHSTRRPAEDADEGADRPAVQTPPGEERPCSQPATPTPDPSPHGADNEPRAAIGDGDTAD